MDSIVLTDIHEYHFETGASERSARADLLQIGQTHEQAIAKAREADAAFR